MPLSEAQSIERFRRDVAATSFVAFRGVILPPRHFAVEGGTGADLLIKRRSEDAAYFLLVDASVRYLGQDRVYRRLFAAAPQRGWRTMAAIRSNDAELVLREVDAVLGLDGQAPRLLAPTAHARRELVVRTEDLASDSGAPAKEPGDRFGTDLVEQARQRRLSVPLFRDNETNALVRILSKAGKNAAVLVGLPGVGKTSVVEGLAVQIASGNVPQTLVHARILDVNLSFLAAGASYKNEFEGRMKELLDLARRDREVILFLDELHTIRAPNSDASQMVKSDLGRGRIRCIGATTNAEFRVLQADAALARRFQVVPVQELTPAQSVAILRATRVRLETHHGVSIPEELFQQIVNLTSRHVPDRHLPDKALDLLDEACACAKLAALRGRLRREGGSRSLAGEGAAGEARITGGEAVPDAIAGASAQEPRRPRTARSIE